MTIAEIIKSIAQLKLSELGTITVILIALIALVIIAITRNKKSKKSDSPPGEIAPQAKRKKKTSSKTYSFTIKSEEE